MEPFYPLRAYVCGSCFLVQLEEFETPDQIFSDYAYFSSYSTSWLEHCHRYAEQMIERFRSARTAMWSSSPATTATCSSTSESVACRCWGSSRRRTSPRSPSEKGIPTLVSSSAARPPRRQAAEAAADLLIGNNVLAHVPDLNDFVAGMKILLKPGGVITMEFPHLLRLIDDNQFDTIYHEHFSYFSFLTVGAGVRGATVCGCSTSRNCRPTAARCGSSARTRTTPQSPTPTGPTSWPSANGEPA